MGQTSSIFFGSCDKMYIYLIIYSFYRSKYRIVFLHVRIMVILREFYFSVLTDFVFTIKFKIRDGFSYNLVDRL